MKFAIRDLLVYKIPSIISMMNLLYPLINTYLDGYVGGAIQCLVLTISLIVILATHQLVGFNNALKAIALVILICTGLELIDVYNLLDPSAELVTNETFITESATSATYWKLRAEKDTGQQTSNPHLLAARIIKEGNTITHCDVNSVLQQQGLLVTKEELDELVSIPFKEYSLDTEGLKDVKKTYPRKMSDNNSVSGVYVFTDNITGDQYVGSSIALGERLNHYFKKHGNTATESLRMILQAIRKQGLQNFTLRIYELPSNLQALRFVLALEQYYILSLNPVNNSLLVVASSPGGKWLSQANSLINSAPICMFYNTVLIYVFNSMVGMTNSALSALKIKSNTLIDCLNTENVLWNKFTFTRGMPTSEQLANANLMKLEKLLELISEAKTAHKKTSVRKPAGRPQSTTSPVTIVRTLDNMPFSFDNFNSART